MAEEELVKQRSPWPPLIAFGLLFLPGAIVAFILWSLFRYGRHKSSVVSLLATIIGVSSGIWAIASFMSVLDIFNDLGSIFETWTRIIPLWIAVSLVIGAPLGSFFVWSEARRLKKYPYLTQLDGSWRYQFTYRRTPFEFFARKKNIRKLKNALLIEPEKAPLGLDEKTDEVVYRYDTEARKHTFMTGASGSGKALHADTLIPTKRGMIRVGRVRVGDYLFDENGALTKVTAKYQPKTPDHYEIKLSNGEVVRACGDHLWAVRESAGSLSIKTLSTREIAKNPEGYYISSLKNPVQGVEKAFVNTRLLGAWLASGAPASGQILKRNQQSKQLLEDQGGFVEDLQKMGWLSDSGYRLKLDYSFLVTTEEARARVLSSALTIGGSYGVDGQTKLSVTDKEAAEFLRSLVFSLGMQASKLEEFDGAYSFKFKDKYAKQQKGTFTQSIGEINRKKAPLRGAIRFESVTIIQDDPDDYYCFTVDSPSHLFLFGTTFTPTHNTITMQSLISADIDVGKTVVVIDFKRSPKFAAKLAAWAEDSGREFYHFMNGDVSEYDIPRSKGQCYYDPLKSGTPTSKADMVLGMREYDSNAAVYKAAMQQLLQVLFSMLKFADKSAAKGIDWSHGGVAQLASVMSGNGLGELIASCSIEVPPGSTKFTYMKPGAGGVTGAQEVYVNTPVARNAIELGEAMRAKGPLTQARDELQGQMRTIIASEYGQWMTTGNHPDDREIDLFELTKEDGNVILFSLNSDSEPDFAQYVGSMIFADLTNISALRRNAGSDNQVNVYVDEFQAVPPTAVTSLLEKSRESKMALTIAQQSFDQVVASADKAGEAYLLSILDTCSNFIAHAGATEDSATRLSKILGKTMVTVYSKTNENDSSFLSMNHMKNVDSKVAAREEERWVYPPSAFMKLSSPDPANDFKASAVWVTKTSADPKYSRKGGATARAVWMIPADRVLVEYYEGKQLETPVKRERKNIVNPEFAPREQAVAEIDFSNLDDELDFVEENKKYEDYTEQQSLYIEDDDYSEDREDDDWDMVEIAEDEIVEEDEPLPPIIEKPKLTPSKASIAVTESLDDLFRSSPPNSSDISLPLPKRPTQTNESLPELKTPTPRRQPSGIPTRPGLPMNRPSKPVEDIALPDIDDIQLPEL